MESTATANASRTVTTPSPPLPHVMASCVAHANALCLVLTVAVIVIPCALLLLDAVLGSRPAVSGRRRRRLPPSPQGLPLVGNLHRSLRALAAAHGPVVLLRLGRVPAVVVFSPAAAREVMLEQDHVFATRPSLAIPRKFLYGCTDIAFAPHGPYWRAARKAAVRHLLGPSRVRAYRAVVREQEVNALLQSVERERCRCVVQLSELLSGFAKDVAGRVVLGVPAGDGDGGGERRAKVDALLGALHAGDFVSWLSWLGAVDGTDARVRRAFARIDGILEEILDDACARMRD